MNEAVPTWSNLVSMFFEQADQRLGRPFLWAKKNGAGYEALTWGQAAETVEKLACGLRRLGVADGDRIVLVSENRPEWLIADLAIMAAGGISVPAYTTNTEADHLHILENSGAKGAIVSTRRFAQRLIPAAHRAADMKFVIGMEPAEIQQHLSIDLHAWPDILTDGEGDDTFDVRAHSGRFRRDDTACIIYTSGTGGAPKGVMLHHGALLHNCEGAQEVLSELGLNDDVFLSFLPLSHSYEHTAGQFFPIFLGAQIYYAESAENLIRNMAEAQPTIMMAVPRLYELIQSRILAGVRNADGLRQKMFMKAVELGRERLRNGGRLPFSKMILDALLEILVRSKVRKRFGGRLKAFVSGGGPLTPEVGEFLTALGIRILQGYGLTESGPVYGVNRPGLVKMDAVGPPLKNTEVRIAEDGEILLRGEMVMQGYWRDPALTAQTVRDGWLHTGDIGELDDDGYLRITDRKKDIIVNSGGDNISPQRVEGLLTLEPEIAQAMVHGDRRPHLVGLLVPDADWLRSWADSNGCAADLPALCENADFRAALGGAVERVNKNLSNIERVRRFIVAREPFTIENRQMTPTLKVRRHRIRAEYGDTLEALYR